MKLDMIPNMINFRVSIRSKSMLSITPSKNCSVIKSSLYDPCMSDIVYKCTPNDRNNKPKSGICLQKCRRWLGSMFLSKLEFPSHSGYP